jgi:hypothetical protein
MVEYTAIINDIWVIWASLVTIASIIIKLTPTVKDDAWLKSVLKFTGKYLALNRTITPQEQKAVNNE